MKFHGYKIYRPFIKHILYVPFDFLFIIFNDYLWYIFSKYFNNKNDFIKLFTF